MSDGRIVHPTQVSAFKLLVSKLERNDNGKTRLFQQIKKHATVQSPIWYNGKPLGKNALGNMMRNLSLKCSLSATYTNHSVRATTITEMCRKGVSASTIMGVSKHKCQQSLTSHYRPSEVDKLRNAALLDSTSTTTSTSTSLVPAQPAQPEPVHPELQGIDLDLLFQPPAPVAPSDIDIDSLITSCSAEELKALKTTQGTHLFNSCSYTQCTITNNITINVVKK